MIFSNGITLSVQFHPFMHYISNRKFSLDFPAQNFDPQPNAEIAVMDKNGKFITEEFFPDLNDSVKGYTTTDEVGELIGKILQRK